MSFISATRLDATWYTWNAGEVIANAVCYMWHLTHGWVAGMMKTRQQGYALQVLSYYDR